MQPDLLKGEVRIRPGFPSDWDRASLKHKDFDFAWKRDGMRETYEFNSRLAKACAPVAEAAGEDDQPACGDG